jgi:uncharacterized membrane protein YadS
VVVGTTVKLARALWIVPLALVTAAVKRKLAKKSVDSGQNPLADGDGSEGAKSAPKIQFPWFILFFLLAAVANTYLPAWPSANKAFFTAGRLGLTATLFLIGSGITIATLKEVGWRPLLQGVLLWLGVGLTSLYFIRIGLIAL